MRLNLTSAGNALRLRVLEGNNTTITFTSIVLGDGANAGLNATRLKSQKDTLPIQDIERTSQHVKLSVYLNNRAVQESYRVTEMGILVKDPDNASNTILYAYGHSDPADSDLVPAYTDEDLECIWYTYAYVGNIDDAQILVNEDNIYYASYDAFQRLLAEWEEWKRQTSVGLSGDFNDLEEALRQSFAGHVDDKNNPHQVTAEQVGLGETETQAKTSLATYVIAKLKEGTVNDMVGSTASDAGQHGLVPAPARGTQNSFYLCANGTWKEIAVMTAASSSAAGSAGLVPAPPSKSNENKFLCGDATFKEPPTMTAATASEAGAKGYAPAPPKGAQDKFLAGDGTYKEPSTMTGATASEAGAKGLVPAPAKGEQDKYLKGDGTYGSPTIDDALSTTSGNAVQNKIVTAELNKKAEVKVVRVSVPTSGWAQNASTGAYEQSVSVTGLLTTDDKRTRVEMVGSTTIATHANIEKAFGCINYVACNTNGQLYLRCDKRKPATTFSVDVVIVR